MHVRRTLHLHFGCLESWITTTKYHGSFYKIVRANNSSKSNSHNNNHNELPLLLPNTMQWVTTSRYDENGISKTANSQQHNNINRTNFFSLNNTTQCLPLDTCMHMTRSMLFDVCVCVRWIVFSSVIFDLQVPYETILSSVLNHFIIYAHTHSHTRLLLVESKWNGIGGRKRARESRWGRKKFNTENENKIQTHQTN